MAVVDGGEGVYLAVQVQARSMVDRAVERAGPLLRRIFPTAVDAELLALDSEVEHLDQVIGSAGLEGRPATAEDIVLADAPFVLAGLPAPHNLLAVPGGGVGARGPRVVHRRRRPRQERRTQVTTSLRVGERGVNWEDPLCANDAGPH